MARSRSIWAIRPRSGPPACAG
ncbi:MAG: hypothetical protein H6916_05220 [Novosphingobium sp.]|nr:hypothetical protein [Novosphingobium sp.]MCP5386204.1 hypothetical protein [Novosphingobium sp.]